MKINIFGSTGVIGTKSLKLLDNYFPNIKINLLAANSNDKLLLKQVKYFKPNFIYINDESKYNKLKLKINNSVKLLNYNELINYLKSSRSYFTILAISGYKSLYFLDYVIQNTDNLGIVSKECIVSAGHIFKKKKYFKKTNIYPLDSEHFSLFEYFNNYDSVKNYKKIIITASGGPFYKHKFKNLKNISFDQASQHPKWKMGYKNSIDSATLVNKCLEVVEAHYLFNIPFNKIDILIHPEAIIHSIVEKNNFVTHINIFKNDMSIPIINFLNNKKFKDKNFDKNLFFSTYSQFNFINLKSENFPIYKFFNKLDKTNPANIIKFNLGNEFAVNLFKKKLIKYTEIYTIIKKVCSLNLYSSLNTIKGIIKYHEDLEKKLHSIFKDKF